MSERRIASTRLAAKRMSADAAARLITPGMTLGMSGFTGAGYPKALPRALARRIEQAHRQGETFKLRLFTGASTGPELDGALAKADALEYRLPYNSDPIARDKINRGEIEYLDLHLSQVAPMIRGGFLGPLDVAVIEVTAIKDDDRLIPSTSLGNNRTFIETASAIILEVNYWQDQRLEGMHDIHYGLLNPPHATPILLTQPADRLGEAYLRCDPDKVIAVIECDQPDRCTPFAEPNEVARRIADHLLEFFEHEVARGRLPPTLLPLQSGVGNVANAVLGGLLNSHFGALTAYTEVLQDSMLELLLAGKLSCASATALGLSPAGVDRFRAHLDALRSRVILRPQEMSNHPEIIRRLGVIAMNGMLECDVLANVNSTHVLGSRIQNGIGGSGDFARNAYLSIFTAPSVVKDGAISTIVPHVSHVDHVPQDVQILVTEQGLADLRGLAPRQRAQVIVERCAHPDYRPQLKDYLARADRFGYGRHAPVLLDEAFGWHQRYAREGSMRG